jgi:NADH-quinone oxidoreductase subunit I
MNCGLCAEFCPFDAIKMDHDYELATFERMEANVHNIDELLKPASYYAQIRPTYYAQEQEAKAKKASKRSRRRSRD